MGGFAPGCQRSHTFDSEVQGLKAEGLCFPKKIPKFTIRKLGGSFPTEADLVIDTKIFRIMSNRREFLGQMGLATAGLALGGFNPLSARGTSGLTEGPAVLRKPSGEKVRIAYIGCGNRGWQDMEAFAATGQVEVTALCDIDINGPQCEKALALYPKAKRFTDFREMFDKAGKDFDAVCAGVPDHIHFPVAMLALNQGKHIYLEKPMIRTFNEAELLMANALRHPEIATQVGNQGHSEANYFQFKAWKDAGIIKDVTAVTAHMNDARRWHGFDPNMKKMPGDEKTMPRDMNWDAWLGACGWRDYSEWYHQGNWRCWYEFGMGALGDWGAHILDTIHEFLNLGLPYEVTLLNSKGHNDFFYPMSSTILFRFPAREGMPPLDITWYDGVDNLPPLPEGYGFYTGNADIPTTNQGQTANKRLHPGKIIYSKDLIFKGGSHSDTLSIIPEEKALEMKDKLPEVPQTPSNHYVNFLRACRGEEKTRSPFEINGVLSQVFCLGVIAQRLGTQLFFDARTKQFTNNAFANALLTGLPPRQGWEEFYKL